VWSVECEGGKFTKEELDDLKLLDEGKITEDELREKWIKELNLRND
jgi:hypothetical protein